MQHVRFLDVLVAVFSLTLILLTEREILLFLHGNNLPIYSYVSSFQT
jgi:hypothetical protein